MAVTGGIPVLIVEGSRPRSLLRAFAGADEGTYVAPGRGLRALKRWLAFFERPARLKARAPDLYEELRKSFRVDPLSNAKR
jgi:glutamate 5-kinase